MKILIADKMSDKAVEELKKLGAEISYNPDLKAEDIPGDEKDADILIVRSTKVKKESIDAMPELSLIIRAGAGVNTIDVEYASSKGIYVANCPGKNTAAVAELAIGLLIAADRQIANATSEMRSAKWKKKEFGKASGLKGRTLGIIGCGMIGNAVIQRALGLEMEVMAWSRSLTPEKAEVLGVTYAATPLDVAKNADAISLHIAATGDTRGMINKEFFEAMKKGAILVNAARGDVIDTSAMKDAIKDKGIKVALDVFENEPAGGEADFEDTELASIVTAATPHIGASTDEASEAIAAETVRIVKTFKETGIPENSVNLCTKSPAQFNLVVRHFNKVGVLAGVLDNLKKDGVNVEEVQNTIFEGGKAACCSMLLDSEPSKDSMKNIKTGENIMQVVLTSL